MEEILDKMPVRGIFEMKVFEDGKLIEEILEENLVVNGGKLQMAHLVGGDTTGRSITKIAFGTSGVDPDPADTIITNQWAKPITSVSYPENGKAQFDWNLLVTENNGMAILEMGLVTADGVLFARKTRTNPIHKASDISMEGHWTIIF